MGKVLKPFKKIAKQAGKTAKKATAAPFKEVGRQIKVVAGEAIDQVGGLIPQPKVPAAADAVDAAGGVDQANQASLENKLAREAAATGFLRKKRKGNAASVLTSASGLANSKSLGKTLLGQ